MEEENKNVNEETVISNQNVEEKKEQQPKNNKGNIILLILIGLMVVCAIIYAFVLKPAYEKDNKKANTNETTEIENDEDDNTDIENNDEENDEEEDSYGIEILPTDSDEIKIAKEKLNAANSLFKDSCDNDDTYGEEGTASMFCYYDTEENFTKNFYGIYSKQLKYEDVYGKFDGTENYTPSQDFMFSYVIKDNKVYHDHCTMGANSSESTDFKVDSVTNDKIEVSYKDNYYDDIENKIWFSKDGKITLVKEDGEWKIIKANVVQWCNRAVEVGK